MLRAPLPVGVGFLLLRIRRAGEDRRAPSHLPSVCQRARATPKCLPAQPVLRTSVIRNICHLCYT